MKMIKKINIDTSRLNNKTRVKKARYCADQLLTIMSSDEFREMILTMDLDFWTKGESNSSAFKKLTRLKIYEKIMSGKEEWNNDEDFEVDLIIDDYYSWGRVVGYMNPGKPTIFVNTKFFDSMSKKKVVSNFCHEYIHVLGARHSGKYLRQSIPYYMNEIVNVLYPILISSEPTIKTYNYVCNRKWYRLWRKKCTKVII